MARERHDCRNGQKYRYGEGGSIREMCKDKSGRCTCRTKCGLRLRLCSYNYYSITIDHSLWPKV